MPLDNDEDEEISLLLFLNLSACADIVALVNAVKLTSLITLIMAVKLEVALRTDANCKIFPQSALRVN